jgi:hypothetical protein
METMKFDEIKIGDVLDIYNLIPKKLSGMFLVKNKDERYIHGLACFVDTLSIIYRNFPWYYKEIDNLESNFKLFEISKHKRLFIKEIFETKTWRDKP